MHVQAEITKKKLLTRFTFSNLWLLYYLQLTTVLLNFKIPYKWNTNLKFPRKIKTVHKPALLQNYSKPYSDLLPLQKTSFRKNFNNITLNMFFIFITINNTPFANYIRTHAGFQLLFMSHNRGGSFTLNLKKCYNRWSNTHALLYNLFYYEHRLMIFGNKIFKIDILALSSFFCKTWTTFFKYPLLFYSLKESIYSHNVVKLMDTVQTFKFESAFVSDLTSSEKMARNLKTCSIYTLGIVSCSDNPWLVSYPVPVTANGLFAQYYFIRYLYHIQQNAAYSRYTQLAKIWNTI